MDWERREDGELKLVVLRDVEIAVAEGEALGRQLLEQAQMARATEGKA